MKTMIVLKSSDPVMTFEGCRPIVYKDGTTHVRNKEDADVEVFSPHRIARVIFEPGEK